MSWKEKLSSGGSFGELVTMRVVGFFLISVLLEGLRTSTGLELVVEGSLDEEATVLPLERLRPA